MTADKEAEVEQAQAQCQRDEPAENHVQRAADLLTQQQGVQATIDRALEDIR